jgi:hypothetical protein
MAFTELELTTAIANSGGAQQPACDVSALLAKLQVLDATGRYAGLLNGLRHSNNKANFLSRVFEATAACQFEAQGLPLAYEVQQVADQRTSIDFLRTTQNGDLVYLELHLLQQDLTTSNDIAAQLNATGSYQVLQVNEEHQREIVRLQSCILSKIQRGDGTPIKFLQVQPGVFNLVVVCASNILLGTADPFDYLLALYGDPEVPEHCRNGIFGLFQESKAEYPQAVQDLATRFAHAKATLHGVVFATKEPRGGVLDYSIHQVTVWNRSLVTDLQVAQVAAEIQSALPSPSKRH